VLIPGLVGSASNTKPYGTSHRAEAFKRFEHDGWEQSVAAYDRLFGALTAQLIVPLIAEVKPAKEKNCSISLLGRDMSPLKRGFGVQGYCATDFYLAAQAER
jgi:hypothetical protein